VTVVHDSSWLVARYLAKRLSLPIHLILHDDWPTTVLVPDSVRPKAHRIFATAYREAQSRFCISPYMEETYHKAYNMPGTVLRPGRGRDCPEFDTASVTANRPLVFAYAGGIHNLGYRQLVYRLATRLGRFGARMLVYATHPLTDIPADAARHLEVRPPLPSAQLIQTLRHEADVLFCPSSYISAERFAMSVNLPSKLTDYTATGLPILVWGPTESSAARWAMENPGAAALITDEMGADCDSAIELLMRPSIREAMGQAALEVGRAQFSFAHIRDTFFEGLMKPPDTGQSSSQMERPISNGD
jgi:hypothetical protein